MVYGLIFTSFGKKSQNTLRKIDFDFWFYKIRSQIKNAEAVLGFAFHFQASNFVRARDCSQYSFLSCMHARNRSPIIVGMLAELTSLECTKDVTEVARSSIKLAASGTLEHLQCLSLLSGSAHINHDVHIMPMNTLLECDLVVVASGCQYIDLSRLLSSYVYT